MATLTFASAAVAANGRSIRAVLTASDSSDIDATDYDLSDAGFTVKVDGATISTDAGGGGAAGTLAIEIFSSGGINAITINFGSGLATIRKGQTVTLGYAGGTDDGITLSSDGTELSDFTDQAVTNNSTFAGNTRDPGPVKSVHRQLRHLGGV